jgi:hypothetical protein
MVHVLLKAVFWHYITNAESERLGEKECVPVIKSRRLRWARHVARMGESRGADRVLVGKPEERRIILKWTLNKWNGGHELDRS